LRGYSCEREAGSTKNVAVSKCCAEKCGTMGGGLVGSVLIMPAVGTTKSKAVGSEHNGKDR